MRGRAAHVKLLNRRAIARPSRRGTQKEKLLERKFALKNISFGQSSRALDIQRRDELFADDQALQIRRVLRNRVDDRVAKSLALLVPRATGQLVRRILHETRKNMFSRWRNRRIG